MKAYVYDGKIFICDENEFQRWITKNGKHFLINVYGENMGEERYDNNGNRLDSKSGLPIKRPKNKILTKEEKEALKNVEDVFLEGNEYRMVMDILTHWLSREEMQEVLFSKIIGNVSYVIYNDPKRGRRVIEREELDENFWDSVKKKGRKDENYERNRR